MTNENKIEQSLIVRRTDLKYASREDIRDRDAREKNFRGKFESLNHVNLTDSEFPRLMEQIIIPDVFTVARHLRERNSFERDDSTPLHYTLVNIKNSHHRYDVLLLINGGLVKVKALAISPRRAMRQIVDYKNDDASSHKILLAWRGVKGNSKNA